MHFVSVTRADGSLALCAKSADEYVDLTAAGCPATLDELLQSSAGLSLESQVREAVRRSRTRYPVDESTVLRPPVSHPGKAIAVGLNYMEHAKEGNKPVPEYPVLFTRYSSSWVGHNESLIKPAISQKFDYEGELVAVIGRAGRGISKERALEHVAGYSLFNDGSLRDFQWRSSQWTMGKNFDRSGAFGPCFVSADSLPPGARGLDLVTRLNGLVVQSASIDEMIFDVATLVSICSQAMTLWPGDIIITGTPSGVGFARTPPLFMKAGDLCEIEIDGIGTLANLVEDEPITARTSNV